MFSFIERAPDVWLFWLECMEDDPLVLERNPNEMYNIWGHDEFIWVDEFRRTYIMGWASLWSKAKYTLLDVYKLPDYVTLHWSAAKKQQVLLVLKYNQFARVLCKICGVVRGHWKKNVNINRDSMFELRAIPYIFPLFVGPVNSARIYNCWTSSHTQGLPY